MVLARTQRLPSCYDFIKNIDCFWRGYSAIPYGENGLNDSFSLKCWSI